MKPYPHIEELQDRLRHRFSNREYLQEALCHRSYINEHVGDGLLDNERLEFLGDAVINLAIADILMSRDPHTKEGDLSRSRANLVNEYLLAEVARRLQLGKHLLLGKGEELSNGREKNSILADAFEAVIGAVYLDSGFDAAFRLLEYHFPAMLRASQKTLAPQDFKSRLQEQVQFAKKAPPVYLITGTSGPDHDRTFIAQVNACGITADGAGKSKKLAEQEAARKALQLLGSETAS